LSNEEKTNDYENFEKRGEKETKSMPHAPVDYTRHIMFSQAFQFMACVVV
jgi:hypothetical protein